MRAVLLEVPQSLIDERRRNEADQWDEMWEGELHMVPPPGFGHNQIGLEIAASVRSLARSRDLVVVYENGVWATDENPESYRIPDVAVVDPRRTSSRGMERGPGVLLAIEIRSAGDEAYLKLPFYGRVAVTELLILDVPARLIRRYTGNGRVLREVTPDDGVDSVRLDTLPGVTISLTDMDPGVRVDMD